MSKICLEGEIFIVKNEYDQYEVPELYFTSPDIKEKCEFGNYYPDDDRTLHKKNTSPLVDVLMNKLCLDINIEQNENDDCSSGKIFLSPGTVKKIRMTIEYED